MSSGAFCWRRARSCAPTALTAVRSTTASLHVVSRRRHRISSQASIRRRLALSLNCLSRPGTRGDGSADNVSRKCEPGLPKNTSDECVEVAAGAWLRRIETAFVFELRTSEGAMAYHESEKASAPQ
jgi:hypothetical protein